MLLCSSKLPVNESLTVKKFIDLAVEWVLQSHNYKFNDFVWNGESEFLQTGENGEIFQIELFEDGNLCAVHFHHTDHRHVEWTTDCVLDVTNSVLAFQLHRDTSSEAEYVPVYFDLPYLIKQVIDAGYFRSVNGINISDKPLFITEDNWTIARDLILRKQIYDLPILYMSCQTDGYCAFNPYPLAKKLRGVAIVLAERSRNVSYILREQTEGKNPYNGAIEIFYAKDKRRILPNELVAAQSVNITNITHEVFDHLLQTKIEDRYLWSQLQSIKLRRQLALAKSAAEADSEDYAALQKMYEDLLKEKEQQISTLSSQLSSANQTKAQLEAQLSTISNIPLIVAGSENDLYPNEQKAFILEVLQKSLTSIPINSRRYDVIRSIISGNTCDCDLSRKRERLKACLNGYTKMNNGVRRALEEIGFTITEDGKHYKLVLFNDPRYTGTLSKTGSDHHGGANTAHDFIRDMF